MTRFSHDVWVDTNSLCVSFKGLFLLSEKKNRWRAHLEFESGSLSLEVLLDAFSFGFRGGSYAVFTWSPYWACEV